jgi:beta-barrel assembly-enhancing protease
MRERLDTAFEKFIGQQVVETLTAANGVEEDPLLLNYVQMVGARVAKSSPRGDVSCRFILLNTSVMNALAAPGGTVLVTRGLLDTIGSENELAGVLAHEVAHVAKRHGMRLIGNNAVFQLIQGNLLKRASRQERNAALAFNGLRSLQKSREMEQQADEYGLRFTAQAGYDTSGLTDFLERISGGDKFPLEEYLTTHPTPEVRLTKARKQIEREGLSSTRVVSTVRRAAPPPLPIPLIDEQRLVGEKAMVVRKGLEKAYRTQRIAAPLQQLMLFNSSLSDLRHLYLIARAYIFQTQVSDVYARASRCVVLAPITWDYLARFEGENMIRQRVNARIAVEKLARISEPLTRASNAVTGILLELNQPFYKLKGNAAWLHLGTIEGLLQYAESELRRADKASREAWLLLSHARLTRYQHELDALVPSANSPHFAAWQAEIARRFVGNVPTNSLATPAQLSIQMALATQKQVDVATLSVPTSVSSDWVIESGGYLENIATALRLLVLDLERL